MAGPRLPTRRSSGLGDASRSIKEAAKQRRRSQLSVNNKQMQQSAVSAGGLLPVCPAPVGSLGRVTVCVFQFSSWVHSWRVGASWRKISIRGADYLKIAARHAMAPTATEARWAPRLHPAWLRAKLSSLPRSFGRACPREGCLQAKSPIRRWLIRSEEHTSELQSLAYLVCRLL